MSIARMFAVAAVASILVAVPFLAHRDDRRIPDRAVFLNVDRPGRDDDDDTRLGDPGRDDRAGRVHLVLAQLACRQLVAGLQQRILQVLAGAVVLECPRIG